jgi:hypothetical protein
MVTTPAHHVSDGTCCRLDDLGCRPTVNSHLQAIAVPYGQNVNGFKPIFSLKHYQRDTSAINIALSRWSMLIEL